MIDTINDYAVTFPPSHDVPHIPGVAKVRLALRTNACGSLRFPKNYIFV